MKIHKMALELLEFCDSAFTQPMFQRYAGANPECKYCGASENREGGTVHDLDCPVIKFKKIIDKHMED